MGEIASESERNPTLQNPDFDTSPPTADVHAIAWTCCMYCMPCLWGSFPLRTFFQWLPQRRSLTQTRTGFGPAASRSKLILCDHVSVRKLPDTEFQSTAYWRTFEDHLWQICESSSWLLQHNNCVPSELPSVLNGCRVQARLMGYEGAWRGRWFGGVWWVWRVSVVRWRSWWRCPGHLHSSCKSPVWRLFSSFINGYSLAIEAQWKDTAYIAYIASLLSPEASPTFHHLMQLYLGSIIVLVL